MQKKTIEFIQNCLDRWILRNRKNMRNIIKGLAKDSVSAQVVCSSVFMVSVLILVAWNFTLVDALPLDEKPAVEKSERKIEEPKTQSQNAEIQGSQKLVQENYPEENYSKETKDLSSLISPWKQGLILYQDGKYELALIFFERAFVENPLHTDLHFYLGNLYHHKGLYAQAVEAYSRGLELASETEKEALSLNLAQSHQAIGNSETALSLYESIDSDLYPQVYLHRGMLYFEEGKREEVISSWTKYLELQPNSNQKESIQKALIRLNDPNYSLPSEEVVSGARAEEETILSADSLENSESESLSEEDIQTAEEQLISQLREQEQNDIQREIERSAENIQIESEDLTLTDLERKEGETFEEIER